MLMIGAVTVQGDRDAFPKLPVAVVKPGTGLNGRVCKAGTFCVSCLGKFCPWEGVTCRFVAC